MNETNTISYRVHPTTEDDTGSVVVQLEFPTRSEESDYGTHIEVPRLRDHAADATHRAREVESVIGTYLSRTLEADAPALFGKSLPHVQRWLPRLQHSCEIARARLEVAGLFLAEMGSAGEPYMAATPSVSMVIESIRQVEAAVVNVLNWIDRGTLPRLTEAEFAGRDYSASVVATVEGYLTSLKVAVA